MESERRSFDAFLKMNARKATGTRTPVVHAQFHSDTMHPDDPLLVMDQDDVLSELDPTSSLVRWLLKQLTTYDCTRQKIVCLIFDRRTVLSEVLWVGGGGDPATAEAVAASK